MPKAHQRAPVGVAVRGAEAVRGVRGVGAGRTLRGLLWRGEVGRRGLQNEGKRLTTARFEWRVLSDGLTGALACLHLVMDLLTSSRQLVHISGLSLACMCHPGAAVHYDKESSTGSQHTGNGAEGGHACTAHACA